VLAGGVRGITFIKGKEVSYSDLVKKEIEDSKTENREFQQPNCPKCGGKVRVTPSFFCTFIGCVDCDWGDSDMGGDTM
jgi:hypothetical protein